MSRIQRKHAQPLAEVLQAWLRASHLTTGMNTHLVFSAWDQASGAGPYTVRKYFRDGKLYITLNSSVVRTQLGFQKDALVQKINSLLESDELFCRDDKFAGTVKELILK